MLDFQPSIYLNLNQKGLITLSFLNKIHRFNKEREEKEKVDFETALRLSRNYERSIRKTRQTIKELCRLNDFKYFLTITFNQEYVDRFSTVEVHKTFKNVIKRLKYNYGDISYLQVPEFHDNGAIHYHLLLNTQIKPKLKYKGLTKKGQAYYTIQDDFKKLDCFLTIEKISQDNPSDYLVKYITKKGFFPSRRKYGCSRSLKREDRRALRIKLDDLSIRDCYNKNIDVYEEIKSYFRLSCFQPYERSLAVGMVCRYTPTGVDLSTRYVKDEKIKLQLRESTVLGAITKHFKNIIKLLASEYGLAYVKYN